MSATRGDAGGMAGNFRVSVARCKLSTYDLQNAGLENAHEATRAYCLARKHPGAMAAERPRTNRKDPVLADTPGEAHCGIRARRSDRSRRASGGAKTH